jgi:plastocyanin/cytochrome c2
MRPERLIMLAGGAIVPLSLSACAVDKGDDLVNGKQKFVQACGSCHTLKRAGTTGVSGPNLDQAFVRSVEDGMKRSTLKGVVHRQIEQPARNKQLDPNTYKPTLAMPADLVKGESAKDVAAYVAYAAARPGQDSGRLGEIGVKKAQGAAEAKNGTLDIPIAQSGLAFTFASANAPAGPITIDAKNPQSTPHNIAIEGNGVDQKGQIVTSGQTSTVKVDLKPGEYTFYCSVPGHREGGMVGKLTVK